MSTLTEELLNDFDDSDVEGDAELDAGADAVIANGGDSDGNDGGHNDEDDDGGDGDDGDDARVEKLARRARNQADGEGNDVKMGGTDDSKSAASFVDQLQPLLDKVNHYQAAPLDPSQINIGNIEDNPEYKVLTQSNTTSTEIDTEVVKVHKYIRDHYSARFPELEGVVQNPLEFAKVVAIVANGPFDTDSIRKLEDSTDNILGESLRSVIERSTLMFVTLEATTTKGNPLPQPELDRILRACRTLIHLDAAKKALTSYVQSRMNVFAPNLTAIVGSLAGAQLINTAGGLTALTRTPSCNLASWGSNRQNNNIVSNVSTTHQGFLFHSPVIRAIPSDQKQKALKGIAAKVVLAARADASHSSPDGSYGEEIKAQYLERLDKMTEPPPNHGQRALPVPDDKPSRKRGGRKARKAKEATAMTELRKAQNRMAFGKEEKEAGYGTGDSTVGMGMIGQAGGDGRIRALQVDNRTRAKLSQKHKGWGGATSLNGGAASSLRGMGPAAHEIDLRGKGLRSSGVGSSVNGGTASSLTFTPAQGLQLVDPNVQAELTRKRKAEEDRWFQGGTFTQVGGMPPPPKKQNTDTSK